MSLWEPVGKFTCPKKFNSNFARCLEFWCDQAFRKKNNTKPETERVVGWQRPLCHSLWTLMETEHLFLWADLHLNLSPPGNRNLFQHCCSPFTSLLLTKFSRILKPQLLSTNFWIVKTTLQLPTLALECSTPSSSNIQTVKPTTFAWLLKANTFNPSSEKYSIKTLHFQK